MSEDKRSTINIRLGEDLLQVIRESAAKRGRSMNAEIVSRIIESINRDNLNIDRELSRIKKINEIKKEEKYLIDRIEAIRSKMGFIDFEIDQLRSEFAQVPKSARGLVIKKMSELEESFSILQKELKSLDPNYRGG